LLGSFLRDERLQDKDPEQIRRKLRGDGELTHFESDGLPHSLMTFLQFGGAIGNALL